MGMERVKKKQHQKVKKFIASCLEKITKLSLCDLCNCESNHSPCDVCKINFNEPCAICTDEFGMQTKLTCCGKFVHNVCFVKSYFKASEKCPFCNHRAFVALESEDDFVFPWMQHGTTTD